MIRELSITNFQSHKDVTLQFTPRVNVIVGASDSGKSALLRSLRWLLLNRPSGTAFRSHWCGKGEATEVRVLLSNGSTITRSRSGKENLYYYQAKGEEALKLEAVRTDVPDEIARLLAIDETVNLQAQADHHFLLDESSPEVARILNAVVGLDGIDQAHTRIAGKVPGSRA